MRQALRLSKLYLLGSLRRQVHLGTILVAILLLLLPSYVNTFSLGLGAYQRVSKDFGLTIITLFGVAMAILLGSTSVPRELSNKAVYSLLARPLSRGSYLAAHLLALMALLAISLLLLGTSLTAALSYLDRSFDPSVLIGTYGAFLQTAVLAAVCLAFSVKCSPPLAGTVGAATFLIGNISPAFIRFFLVEDRDSIFAAALAKALKAVVPNLSLFNIKDPMVHGLALPHGYLLSVSYYAAIWVFLVLAVAHFIFRRVDL